MQQLLLFKQQLVDTVGLDALRHQLKISIIFLLQSAMQVAAIPTDLPRSGAGCTGVVCVQVQGVCTGAGCTGVECVQVQGAQV